VDSRNLEWESQPGTSPRLWIRGNCATASRILRVLEIHSNVTIDKGLQWHLAVKTTIFSPNKMRGRMNPCQHWLAPKNVVGRACVPNSAKTFK
jgi:hypothetical protein